MACVHQFQIGLHGCIAWSWFAGVWYADPLVCRCVDACSYLHSKNIVHGDLVRAG